MLFQIFGLCYESLQDGQPSTRQTPAQVTCAHCQRSSEPASAPCSVLATEVPEGAAHYTAVFVNVNTCPRIFLLPPDSSEPPSYRSVRPTGPRILQHRFVSSTTRRNRLPYRAPSDLTIRRPGRASYSFVSVRQHSPKPPFSALPTSGLLLAGPRILQPVSDSSTLVENRCFCAFPHALICLRAAHRTACFRSVNTFRNRRLPRVPPIDAAVGGPRIMQMRPGFGKGGGKRIFIALSS